MKYGVCLPNYGEISSTEIIARIALESEKLGYDSLWATDHVLMQRNSNTPYERIFESITTLAYLAGITSRVRLGISSLIVAMRNPIVVAKQLATVDNLSKGRVLLAVGAGWNETEFSFLGADFHRRGKILNESIKLIRSLWNGNDSFNGKYIKQHYINAVFEPRPVSNLEVWVGGVSKAAMIRAVKIGDAWHPNAYPLDTFGKMISDFRSLEGSERKKICVRIGINLDTVKQEYLGPRGERRLSFSADMEENKKLIEALESLGISYLLLVPNHDGNVPEEKQIRALQEFASKFI
jgi:probable F420-dependent oxidoreductase